MPPNTTFRVRQAVPIATRPKTEWGAGTVLAFATRGVPTGGAFLF